MNPRSMLRPRSAPAEPSATVSELPQRTELADVDLVERARTGDRWAEEALYHRHVQYLMGMVIRLLGDRVESEDIVQDTFVIALDRMATLRQPEAVRAWLAQIAVSLVRRRLRRARLLSALGFGHPLAWIDLESVAVKDADAQTRLELASAARALSMLPTNERLAWMLRHVEGESLDQISRMCDCSLATAKRRVKAAEQHLDRHFEDGGAR
jgi:RNA polymerase sigma-70 factor (ECF subfamily)